MHVYGRGGHSNQIAMIARGCNEKHENNSGKASAITLEYYDKKLQKRRVMIWSSGRIGDCRPEVGVQYPWKTFFSRFNISSEIRCEFRIEHCKMLI